MRKSILIILWPLLGYGLAKVVVPEIGLADGEIHLLVLLTLVIGALTGGGALFIGLSPLVAIPSLIAVGFIQYAIFKSAKSVFEVLVKWIGLVAGIAFIIHGVQKLFLS